MRTILGVSADYHDSAAAILVDGELVAAVQEERFTRIKHDSSMPRNAIAWCLDAAGTQRGSPVEVVFYEKPLTSYERILATHALVGPRGFRTLAAAVSKWSRSSLWVEARIEQILADIGFPDPQVRFAEHHVSHACSAFYPSPFESAAVLTFDAVGEWATSSIAHGSDVGVRIIDELMFPDSLGLFYSAMTAHCGFEVNDGEYKMMGLAPYGEPRFVDALRSDVIDIAPDGSVRLDQRFFAYRSGTAMASRRLADLLDGPPLPRDSPPGQREADIARSTQLILEEAILSIAGHAHDLTGESRACLAGGVALNCVANARLLAEGPFDEIWIQPAAGDSGAAIGAAYWAWHELGDHPRAVTSGKRRDVRWIPGAKLRKRRNHAVAHRCGDRAQEDGGRRAIRSGGRPSGRRCGCRLVSRKGRVRPPSLGAPIDPCRPEGSDDDRSPEQIHQEARGFRPFAPAIMAEHAGEWFEPAGPSPYMVVTKQLKADRRIVSREDAEKVDGSRGFSALLSVPRSEMGACTHVDYSARVQTVDESDNPSFHRLLDAFHRRTGCPALLNTSFNQSGEPIVLTPADALRTSAAVGSICLYWRTAFVHPEAILEWATR
ncbi:MAG: hypothetical protein M5U19_20320 [Microthrixaceae bacterium]|nr:hypothetical protein [Microthrixaceae bacterium]